MKIILIMLPFANIDQIYYGILGKGAKDIWTVGRPLGLAYLASVLRNNGHSVEIIDCMAEDLSPKIVEDRLQKKTFDVIGMSVVTPAFLDAVVMSRIAKKVNPKCKIVMGGAHPTVMTRAGATDKLISEKNIDFAIYGEGEITIKELITAIGQGKGYENIDGLIWKKNKKVVVNKPREPIENLDELPFPAFDLLTRGKYYRSPSSVKKEPEFPIMTSRGCPYDCTFCNKIFGRKIRTRSVENVMKELWFLKNKMGAREIRVWDETFTINKKYVIDICKEMIKTKYHLPWSCYGHVNTMDPEMLKWMKRAGCWQIDFGIESGNDMILKAINKNINKEQTRRDIKLVKKAGIEPRAFFIFGFPEDTKETIEETIEFALELDPTYAAFYILQIYPGTKIFYQLIEQDGENYDAIIDKLMKERVYFCKNKNLTHEEIIDYVKIAHRKFYRRPAYLIKMLLKLRSFEDFKRQLKGGLQVLKI